MARIKHPYKVTQQGREYIKRETYFFPDHDRDGLGREYELATFARWYYGTEPKTRQKHIKGIPSRDNDVRRINPEVMDIEFEVNGENGISWIWQGAGISPTDQTNINECLRIAWCKARARARRWQEEGILLQEEMRRVLETLEFEAQVWDSHAKLGAQLRLKGEVEDSLEISQGRVAFAARQAQIRRRIRLHCGKMWQATLLKLCTGPGACTLTDSHWDLVGEFGLDSRILETAPAKEYRLLGASIYAPSLGIGV
ncbi:hypothetical protein D9757_010248 [Collybiopsis confluens]|uniref:Uncharacterized protein n=1 Tax=Collybiopsis confluens TaxID=2823264 RepID=A0A8H5HB55_9AGAR|nr:hypothetical protein D9757_010248 [Collybiopsis confluens]